MATPETEKQTQQNPASTSPASAPQILKTSDCANLDPKIAEEVKYFIESGLQVVLSKRKKGAFYDLIVYNQKNSKRLRTYELDNNKKLIS